MKLKLLLSLEKSDLRSIGSKLGMNGIDKMNKEQLVTRLSSKSYKEIVKAHK